MPHENIDVILENWPYVPGNVLARRSRGEDGREVLQMRVEMGVLQMEVGGRPDGQRPHGAKSYLAYLTALAGREKGEFVLSQRHRDEVDREFVQFYHRRVCWLALREFRRAQRDAEHTLRLMDFSSAHASDEQWILSHEQYRPFVMFHHIQAEALAELEENGGEVAIDTIDAGLGRFKALYAKYEAAEQYDGDELVARLLELKESIRNHYELGQTLSEELAEAVKAEEYERAAKLRDEIARRRTRDDQSI